MRQLSHLTPRYVLNRLALMAHERRHPEQPWITPAATNMLNTLLLPTDIGFEFGSGRSTVWYAKRVRRLTSIEENRSWASMVQSELSKQGLTNAEVIYVDCSGDRSVAADAYVSAIRSRPDDSLDFVMVDGNFRGHCTVAAIPKLKPGGLLVIDNVERHLPCDSTAPGARTRSDGPDGTDGWPQVWAHIESWRKIWTS
jgi:predicted O-methyltransferase YrrM